MSKRFNISKQQNNMMNYFGNSNSNSNSNCNSTNSSKEEAVENVTKKLNVMDIIDRNMNILRSIVTHSSTNQFTIDHSSINKSQILGKKRELSKVDNKPNQLTILDDSVRDILNIKTSEKKIKTIEQKRKLTNKEIDSICNSLQVSGNGEFEHMVELMNNVRQDVKSQLLQIEIYPSLIPKLKEQIVQEYYKSQINPGQMVGVDSATSLGEPTTQMSIHKDEKIKVLIVPKKQTDTVHKLYHGTISEMCDTVISQVQSFNSPDQFIQKENNGKSVIVDLSCFDKHFYIVGVNQNETCNWNRISHISKHPVNGKMMKIRTFSGRTVCTTLSHSHLKRSFNGGVEPVEGRFLKIGDRIPVLKNIDSNFEFEPVKDSTYVNWINEFFSVNFNLDTFRIESDVFMYKRYFKVVFIQKLLQYFSSVIVDSEHYTVTIGSTSNLNLLQDLLFLLNHMNIVGIIEIAKENNNLTIIEEIQNDIENDIQNDIESEISYKIVDIIKNENKNENGPKYNLFISGIYYTRFVNFVYNGQHWEQVKKLVNPNPIMNEDVIPNLNQTLWGLHSVVSAVYGSKDEAFLPPIGQDVTRRHGYLKLVSLEQKYNMIQNSDIKQNLRKMILQCVQALNSDVFWDRIVDIEIYTPEDQNEFVFDFTVPGCETFMVDSGIIVHNTLNTFHTSGISCAAVTTGVPRFRELLDASKQQKHSLITFELIEQPKTIQQAKLVARSFDEKRIFALLQKQIPNVQFQRHLNLSESDKFWYIYFEKNQHQKFQEFQWSLRFEFDKSQLFEFRISMKNIAKVIEQQVGNCYCVYSPDFLGIIDVYFNTANISVDDVINYRKQNDGIKQKQEKMRKYTFINETNKDFYFLRDILFQYIGHLKVSGIYCIDKSHFRQRIPDKNWIFELEGTNFREIINHPSVNFKTCYINNIWEIYSSLGIEAVRSFLISEFDNIIVSGGMNVDRVHLELLADSMTCTGNITSVSRYGIGRNETGPLTKASFEQSLDNMLIAAYRSETETIQSVSSCVILGQCSTIGSGMIDLYTKLAPSVNYEQTEEEYNPETPQMLYETKRSQVSNDKVIIQDIF